MERVPSWGRLESAKRTAGSIFPLARAGVGAARRGDGVGDDRPGRDRSFGVCLHHAGSRCGCDRQAAPARATWSGRFRPPHGHAGPQDAGPRLPCPTPVIPRLGIVSGHRGNDSGSVCKDGLTEASINFDIASRVVYEMRQRGYQVDLLDEFDPRLTGYRALLLLSIHADSCDYINDQATGYKVAHVLDSKVPRQEDKLVACLTDHYAARTGMTFHENSITRDMTNYHGFYEIAPDTPGAIIEIGFLYLDRPILTQRADLVAQGIVDGLMCYLGARSGL